MTQMDDQERLQRLTTACGWLAPHARMIENLAQVQRGLDLASWMREQGHMVLVAEERATYAFGRVGKRVEVEASRAETLLELHPDRVREEGSGAHAAQPASISATADQIVSWASTVYTELSDDDREQLRALEQILRESAEHLR